jgi:TPR repeat protein
MRYIAPLLFILALVAQPVHAKTLDALLTDLNQAARQADKEQWQRLEEEIAGKNSVRAYVELARFYEDHPTPQKLKIADYPKARYYYEKALSITKGTALDDWSNRARTGLANLYLDARVRNPDLERGMELLQQAIKGGSTKAALQYAEALERGVGAMEPDPEAAAYWYRYALRGQDGEAALALASLYRYQRIEQPDEQAVNDMMSLGISLLKADASEGDISALLRLAEVYSRGEGVEQDLEQAINYYSQAAEAGSLTAHTELAELIATVKPHNQHFREYATQLVRNAANNGSTKAAMMLAMHLNKSTQDYYYLIDDDTALLWLNRALQVGYGNAIEQISDYYLRRGEAEKAVREMQQAASKDSIDAMLLLYKLYRTGNGVEKNDSKAIYYFTQAYEHPRLEADNKAKLARLMFDESELVYNRQLAQKLLKEAATEGSTSAMTDLASYYERGRGGFPKDLVLAFLWYSKASAANDAGASLKLAHMYKQGRGVSKNEARAEAIEQAVTSMIHPADGSTMSKIAMAYKKGIYFEKDLNAAASWLDKAIAAGDKSALLELGVLVQWGGVDQYGPADSVRFFRRAAEAGSQQAWLELGNAYASGMVVPVDQNKAVYYYRQAARVGSKDALRQLGLSYLDGIGVRKNEALGLEYLINSANAGKISAMLDLGAYHALNDNIQDALQWWRLAASFGNEDAHYFIGKAYKYGNGVPKNLAIARQYLEKAAANDNLWAQNELKRLPGA